MTNITILGTGAMGSRLAKKLLESNYAVTIFNRTKKHAMPLIDSGAKFFETAREAVIDADIIISMLTNDEASKTVWLDNDTGAINGLKKGAIAIESSTLSKTWIDELATEFNSRGIEFLDAPVVGSKPQAENAELIFLVGGSKESLDKSSPVLSKLSSSILHIGPIGSGIKMKLAVNAFFGVQVSALSELIGLMEQTGIEKEKTVDFFNRLPTTSPALQGIGKMIAANNFSPLFPINLIEKDFRYILDMASLSQSQLPVIKATHNVFTTAIEANYGEDNVAGVAKLYL